MISKRPDVNKGQFSQVLIHELYAIRRACNSLEDNYQPRITFIVVQKGHRTKLFSYHHDDPNSADRTWNVLSGIIVDSYICRPKEFDFYLNRHARIQGTNNPMHYHVLWDENSFSADSLQSITYSLCYTYARCTRSVSAVPPIYYAHLAATHARFYYESTDAGTENTGIQGTDYLCIDALVLGSEKY